MWRFEAKNTLKFKNKTALKYKFFPLTSVDRNKSHLQRRQLLIDFWF
jgi:hypothetical protein